jgi:GR25 family glycosyltransferase involved in LPS biosynthesis
MEHIDRIVYINLNRRKDRRTQIQQELERMDVSGIRFEAIETIPGYIGCTQSHLEVLRQARDAGARQVAIFEDDFQWIVSKQIVQTHLRAFFESHISYDVLMLSYNIQQSEPYNTLVSYAREAQTASGYIVHSRFYDTLIQTLEEALPRLVTTGHHWLYMNDQIWKSLQKHSEWFYFNTRLGQQRPGFSDLANKYVEYGV